MNKPQEGGATKAADSIQELLTSFACDLKYADLPADVVLAAKGRIIDTLGALIAGFFGEPCRIVRNVAAQFPQSDEATIIGTRRKTAVDMAGFVNATTARYPELNDVYDAPGDAAHGHPSDCVAGIFTSAEYTQAKGRDLITGVVIGYDVYQRFCDNFYNLAAFDNTNFSCLGIAMAASRFMKLSAQQTAHAISMAIVPNNILRQARAGKKSMYKATAAGQGARSGIFAALLARAGMEGPHLPFEGKAGWRDHVALGRFELAKMGGTGVPFKILEALMKPRPAWAYGICLVLAAEKIAPLNYREVRSIKVEVYQYIKESTGDFAHTWNPQSREDADHSAPYLIASTLMDGNLTLRSFDHAHLTNPDLRELMKKVDLVANPEFTQAHERRPQQHRARITVLMNNGERLIGESGGDQDDFAAPKTPAQIEEKFRMLTEGTLSAKQIDVALDRLWHLDDVRNVAEIPPLFVFD